MAKVQRIPVGRKPGQRKIELPEQVEVSLTELGGVVKEGLLAFAAGVGFGGVSDAAGGGRDGGGGPEGPSYRRPVGVSAFAGAVECGVGWPAGGGQAAWGPGCGGG